MTTNAEFDEAYGRVEAKWDEKLIAVSVFYTGCVFKAIDTTIGAFRESKNPIKHPLEIGAWDASAAVVLAAYLGWLALHFYRSIYRYFPDSRQRDLGESAEQYRQRMAETHLMAMKQKRPRLFGYAHLGISLGLFYLLAANLGPPNRNQATLAFLLVLWDLLLVLPFTERFLWLKKPWREEGVDSRSYWWAKNSAELAFIAFFYTKLPPGGGWRALGWSLLAFAIVGGMAFRQRWVKAQYDSKLAPIWSALTPRSRVAVIVALLFGMYQLTYSALDLPSAREMIDRSRELYVDYGHWAGYFSALVEGLLLVGWYMPGSIVVVLGAVFASEGIISIWTFTAAAIAGFLSAYTLNYFSGRYGWYRVLARFGAEGRVEAAADRIHAMTPWRRFAFLALMYFSPNLGGLSAAAQGTMQAKFSEFAAPCLIGTVFWSSVWAALAYHAGDIVLDVMAGPWFFLVIILALVVIIRGI